MLWIREDIAHFVVQSGSKLGSSGGNDAAKSSFRDEGNDSSFPSNHIVIIPTLTLQTPSVLESKCRLIKNNI